MEAPETFHQYSLTIDPHTKAIESTDPGLAAELEELNRIHRGLLVLETPHQIPGPPMPVNPKRTVQIGKLKESGNAEFKKAKYAEAINFYDLAIRMALDRPPWEPAGLVREELVTLYNNRAAGYMALQKWPEASVDAETAVELKKIANVKAWFRRGACLREMGRLEEADEWVRNALEFERGGPERANLAELEALQKEILQLLGRS